MIECLFVCQDPHQILKTYEAKYDPFAQNIRNRCVNKMKMNVIVDAIKDYIVNVTFSDT